MRASSLSSREVIDLVSRYFVPVLLSRDDYGETSKSRSEDAEWRRIQRAAGQRGLKFGNVCVYVVDPDGTPAATMVVSEALTTERLIALLQQQVHDRKLTPRSAETIKATRKPLDRPPAPRSPGGMMIHVQTRYLTNEAEKGIGEDWVELTANERAALLPAPQAKPGATWSVDRAVTDKVFRLCYPPVCEYHAERGKIHSSTLTAQLTSVDEHEARISLRGELDLEHSRDGNVPGRVTARFIGLATYDPAHRVVKSFRLVSRDAGYTFHWQNKPNPSRIAIGIESVGSPEAPKASNRP